MPPMPSNLVRLAGLYLGTTAAGYVAICVGIPLPWMIGPLLLSGVLAFSGLSTVIVPVATRPFGQAVVAAQVGLYFTAEAFAALAHHAPLMIGMALIVGLIALFVALLLARIGHIDLIQALIAMLPTSPVEASVMAEAHGFPAAPVILSQALRNGLVVVTIPITIYYLDGTSGTAAPRAIVGFHPMDNMLLALISVTGVVAFRKLRIANPWFLGPLAFVALVSLTGVHFAAVPTLLLWAAQIVLGTWLGSTFRRRLFTSAGRHVTASVFCTILFIVLCGLAGTLASRLIGLPWEVMLLASAPGGVTEMALTAKVMAMDVALVTAFHLTRIFLIVPNIPWFVRMIARHAPICKDSDVRGDGG